MWFSDRKKDDRMREGLHCVSSCEGVFCSIYLESRMQIKASGAMNYKTFPPFDNVEFDSRLLE